MAATPTNSSAFPEVSAASSSKTDFDVTPDVHTSAACEASSAPQTPDAALPSHNEGKASVSAAQRARGAAQMAGGAALAVAGVPMLVLPGPGAVAIVGGAAMASKGHRVMTGREVTPVEAKLDAASEKMVEVTKDQAEKALDKVAMNGPDVVARAREAAPMVAGKAAVVATKGAGMAVKGLGVVVKGAVAAGKIAGKMAGKAGAKHATRRKQAKKAK